MKRKVLRNGKIFEIEESDEQIQEEYDSYVELENLRIDQMVKNMAERSIVKISSIEEKILNNKLARKQKLTAREQSYLDSLDNYPKELEKWEKKVEPLREAVADRKARVNVKRGIIGSGKDRKSIWEDD